MNARDQLAGIVYRGNYNNPASPFIQALEDRGQDEIDRTYKTADAILAAGYSKPRTITTVEELDALPVESVVLGWAVGGRTVYLRAVSGRGRLVWGCVGSSDCYESANLLKENTPATVIYEGDAA